MRVWKRGFLYMWLKLMRQHFGPLIKIRNYFLVKKKQTFWIRNQILSKELHLWKATSHTHGKKFCWGFHDRRSLIFIFCLSGDFSLLGNGSVLVFFVWGRSSVHMSLSKDKSKQNDKILWLQEYQDMILWLQWHQVSVAKLTL